MTDESTVGEVLVIERYTFSLNVELSLGAARQFALRDWIDMDGLRVRVIQMNAPCAGFVHLDEVCADNVTLIEDEDAFLSDPAAPGGIGWRKYDPPRELIKGARARGSYTGIVPDGYHPGGRFLFCITFVGSRLELLRK